ncbi:hypothetical protein ACI78R_19335 [Geodermatophilus sp. SYSU D01106]
MPDGPRTGWWARLPAEGEPGSPAQRVLAAVLGDAFPAGSVVDLPDGRLPGGWQLLVRADAAGDRVRSVQVAMPTAPLLWYVELPEPAAAPPATTLVAFSDARFADGTVLTAAEARRAGVRGEEQVAALRWWTGPGLVHQVYVGPAARRRGVGTKLVQVAYGVQHARGGTPLHGDGRRTDDGEAWSRALPAHAAWRVAERTERLPSMTPA